MSIFWTVGESFIKLKVINVFWQNLWMFECRWWMIWMPFSIKCFDVVFLRVKHPIRYEGFLGYFKVIFYTQMYIKVLSKTVGAPSWIRNRYCKISAYTDFAEIINFFSPIHGNWKLVFRLVVVVLSGYYSSICWDGCI